MNVRQLFYVSRATVPYETNAVKAILAQSQRNNLREEVTGCLLFSGCYFAQVLEGDQSAIDTAMSRIQSDDRHSDFRLLAERHVDERTYSQWQMGYLHDLTLEDDLEGLLLSAEPEPERVLHVMSRMQPDPVSGVLA